MVVLVEDVCTVVGEDTVLDGAELELEVEVPVDPGHPEGG